MVLRQWMVLGLLVGVGGAAQAAMRCGNELVTEGDSVVKLLEHCGEPTIGDSALYLETAEWTYDFGPNELMKRVLIRDGKVERIEELGFGTGAGVGAAREELDVESR